MLLSDFLKKKYDKEKMPVWLMRQAGRYLPEYQEIRKQHTNFLNMCYSTETVKELTLQPIKRFDLDFAIIFSDILTILDNLGIDTKFLEGIGPVINCPNISSINFGKSVGNLNYVYESISLTRNFLDPSKSLIGFAGSPFTLAAYLFEGGSSKDFMKVKQVMSRDPAFFRSMVNELSEKIIEHLGAQIEAGADVVQMFDSWAGILNESEFGQFVFEPTYRIFRSIREKYPKVPIIWFPRNAYSRYSRYLKRSSNGFSNFFDVLSVDQFTPLNLLVKKANKKLVLQGNLDPVLLHSGSKEVIEIEVKKILKKVSGRRHIFNLGHGVLPGTPIENVQLVVDLVRA